MNGLQFRPYAPGDKAACLDIFMSNTPRYFGVEEVDDFRGFLDAPTCAYFVVAQNEQIIACGGYGYHDKKKAVVLAWGMVRVDLHKQGLGTFMLIERLKHIYREYGETLVLIETSQHSRSFFEKFGFEATNTIQDFFAPGIDRVDMQLKLNSEAYASLTNHSNG
jgi:predicted GNAT family N-acyltransferase